MNRKWIKREMNKYMKMRRVNKIKLEGINFKQTNHLRFFQAAASPMPVRYFD